MVLGNYLRENRIEAGSTPLRDEQQDLWDEFKERRAPFRLWTQSRP